MEREGVTVGQQGIDSNGEATMVVLDYQNNRPRRISDDLRAAAERAEAAGGS